MKKLGLKREGSRNSQEPDYWGTRDLQSGWTSSKTAREDKKLTTARNQDWSHRVWHGIETTGWDQAVSLARGRLMQELSSRTDIKLWWPCDQLHSIPSDTSWESQTSVVLRGQLGFTISFPRWTSAWNWRLGFQAPIYFCSLSLLWRAGWEKGHNRTEQLSASRPPRESEAVKGLDWGEGVRDVHILPYLFTSCSPASEYSSSLSAKPHSPQNSNI